VRWVLRGSSSGFAAVRAGGALLTWFNKLQLEIQSRRRGADGRRVLGDTGGEGYGDAGTRETGGHRAQI
jgi:hypothetical protein